MTSLCNFPLRSFLMTSDNLISLLAINRWRWFYYQSEISDSHIFHLSSSFFFFLLIILSLLPLRIKQFLYIIIIGWCQVSPPQIKFHMKYFFGRICSDNISECVPPLNWILNISQHLLDVIRSEINFLKLLFVLFYCVLFFLLT